MSGQGAHGPNAPSLDVGDAGDLSVVIIASSWHQVVMDGLIAGAQAALADGGLRAEVVRVPGSFELPIVAAALARRYDAIIGLGVIIRGGTPHFDYVCSAATDGLARVALESGTPVGFGVLTCDDEAQALDRAGLAGSREDKGREAAEAAVTTAVILRGIQE